MNDFRQLFGSYNLCARFAPGFLFVIAIYFLLGYDISLLENNSIIFMSLIIILSGIFGFTSASLIKFVEQFIWEKFENPVINYLSKKHFVLYNKLSNKHKDKLLNHILAITRNDTKLFWKNVSYGFFRNSILLSLLSCFFSYSSKYFCYNICIVVFAMIMTCICSRYYAHQAIESYLEKQNKM